MERRFFAGKPVSFEEAFPDIKEITIDATEGCLGSGFSSGRKMTLTKETLSAIEPCSNSCCKNGGHNLGSFISEMYHKKESSKEDTIMCNGYERMGRKATRRCLNGLKVKVNIKY